MSDPSLRDVVLERYVEVHARTANASLYENIRAPWPYFEVNYRALVAGLPKTARVIDVGCGAGSLLLWLRTLGFQHLEGIDASPGDVASANELLGGGVDLGDAVEHLERRPATYDLVCSKALFEHLPRPVLTRAVHAVAASLRPGGLAIVDVPNMDWLLAPHERYMDLTHEGGFTRESLHALFSLEFSDVTVRGSRLASPTRSQRWFRGLLVRGLRRVLYVLGEGASDVLFESRSIIAVACDPRGMR